MESVERPLRRSARFGFTLVDPNAPLSSGVRLSNDYRSDTSLSLNSSGTFKLDYLDSISTDSDTSPEAVTKIVNYSMSPNIALILRVFREEPVLGIREITELAEAFQETLQTLSQVHCNKVAAQMLGARVEDSVLILGETACGLLTEDVARPSQKGMITTHVGILLRCLGQMASYLRMQGSVGWLQHSLRLEGSAPLQYKILDDGLLGAVNALVLAVGCPGRHLLLRPASYGGCAVDVKRVAVGCPGRHLLLRPASYGGCAVDVKRVAESLGTLSVIVDSPAKLLRLAHSIQASPLDLHSEITQILQRKQSGRFKEEGSSRQISSNDSAKTTCELNENSKGPSNITKNTSKTRVPERTDKWSLSDAIFKFFQI